MSQTSPEALSTCPEVASNSEIHTIGAIAQIVVMLAFLILAAPVLAQLIKGEIKERRRQNQRDRELEEALDRFHNERDHGSL